MSPVGGYQGSTFSDLIERTYRRLMSEQNEVVAKLNVAYTAGDGSITLRAPALNSIGPGTKFAIAEEVYRCDTWTSTGTNTGTATITVADGSSDSNHVINSDVYINPKFTRFDIGVAINDALNALSSPTNGMFQVGTTTITYTPPYAGFDLGAVPANFTRILEITADHPYPDSNFIRLLRYDIVRGITNAKFPSGRGIILKNFDAVYPGFTVNIAYGYPYTQLVNLTDDVETTSGLQASAIDIPSLLAQIFLTEPREIKRNFIESQPDVRKATDVPAGAVANSMAPLIRRVQQRISEEADRLQVQWPRQKMVL